MFGTTPHSDLCSTTDAGVVARGSFRLLDRKLIPQNLNRRLRLPSGLAHARKSTGWVCATASSTEVGLEKFNNWVSESIQGESKTEIDVLKGDLVLRASDVCNKGDVVLAVPETAWITPEVVAKSSIGGVVGDLEPWLQIALFLVNERSDPTSQWTPYLDSLPVEPLSPAFWPDEELTQFENSQLWRSALGYRQFFAGKFNELQSGLFKQNPNIFAPDVFTYEAFSWGVGTVRARAHPPLEGDKLALVPVADQVFHSRYANVQWELASGGLFGKNSLVLKALEPISQGEILRMDYGPGKLDNQVALDYGVTDSMSQKGGFLLSMQLPDSDPYFDDKIDILEVSGMGQNVNFNLLANEEPSTDLLAFLRLLNCQGADAFHLEALFRNDSWEHMSEALSEENEDLVCKTMISGCEEALCQYMSAVQDDRAKLAEGGLSQREELGTEICLGEKSAIEWTLRWFQQRANELRTLEYYAERRLKDLGLQDEDGNQTDWMEGGIA